MALIPIYVENSLKNINYLLEIKSCSDGQVDAAQMICVDPTDATPILHYVEQHNCNLRGILVTHYHLDHISGIPSLMSKYPQIQVFGPRISCPKKTIPLLPTETSDKVLCFDHSQGVFMSERDAMSTKGITIHTFEVPGHCPEHILFHIPNFRGNIGALVVGDTLTYGGVGNCHGGNVRQLYDSIYKTILKFDDKTLLFCGHDYLLQNLKFSHSVYPENKKISDWLEKVSKNGAEYRRKILENYSLGMDKQINLFFMLNDLQLKKHVHLSEESSAFAVFEKIRLLRDQF